MYGQEIGHDIIMTEKKTIYNLQCDWDGILRWHGLSGEEVREIKKIVADEVEAYREQSWWRRLFNMMPESILLKSLLEEKKKP